MALIRVALPLPLDRLFTYRLDDDAPVPARGSRVDVSFGRRRLVGFAVEPAESAPPGVRLRHVRKVLDAERVLSDTEWALAEWMARYTLARVEKLMSNPGIVRNRLKILSTIDNARAFLKVQKEFGSFDAYVWGFVGGKPRMNRWISFKNVPASSPESDALSADLRRRGFRFVGSTICYAFMQAVGMVNDHTADCFRRR